MPARRAVGILGALTLLVVLSLSAPGLALLALFTLALPVAFAAKILVEWRRPGRQERDTPERLLSVGAALSSHHTSSNRAPVDWAAAFRAELASITDRRERLRFALGAVLAMLGAPRRLRSGLLAVCVGLAFAACLLGYSRATVGQGGLGAVSALLPAVLLFTIGGLCAWSTGSLRFAVETGALAAFMSLLAVAVVFGVEATRWFEVAHVYILDGDYADVGTSRAAVLDALNPVILLVHLLFWLPWPVLGAMAGIRARRHGVPSPRPTA